MHQPSKSLYKVIGKKRELENITTIQFVLDKDSTVPTFIAGQYINIFVEDQNTTEGKSYSISSSPEDSFLAITVKEMGQFSKYLTNLNVGDVIEASDPYGYFYSENNDTNLIFVIAGISITPAMSMIRYFSKNNPERKMCLFYSSSFKEHILFKEELDEITKSNLNIKVIYFITKDEEVSEDYRKGRIVPKEITREIDTYSLELQNNEYFICGSITFVRDMWDGIREMGINEEQIYTEAFFSH